MSRTGKTKALTRRQARALAALVEHATVTSAARACGIGASTIRRWIAEDTEFSRLLSDAQARVTAEAFGRLAVRAEQAVETLERNLSSGAAGVETRAALGWLALLHKKAESTRYQAMEAELQRLHELLDGREQDKEQEK